MGAADLTPALPLIPGITLLAAKGASNLFSSTSISFITSNNKLLKDISCPIVP